MENLYLIQLTFYDGSNEISLYWLPDRNCFTFSQPRALIPASDLSIEANNAEQHARQVMQGRPFHLYTHAITAALGRAPVTEKKAWGRS